MTTKIMFETIRCLWLFQRPDVLHRLPCLHGLAVLSCRLEPAFAQSCLSCLVQVTEAARLRDLGIHHPTVRADQERNGRHTRFFVTQRRFRIFRLRAGIEVGHCFGTARAGLAAALRRRRCRRLPVDFGRRRLCCVALAITFCCGGGCLHLHFDRRDERRRRGLHFRRRRRGRRFRRWRRFHVFDNLGFHCLGHLADHRLPRPVTIP
jgi:hypothetical protein